jgi:alkanesulfonate monooxygenase SsuD/methylene tetrahydromethanopterin reductase-like flavin-dependent oxidoreductase (luciferase family)
MDFGLFYYCQGRGVAHDQEMLDQIALAEDLGFGECWFAEHHFTEYSLLPSPNLMIAAALQRTRRMRFGNYINVLPMHHPLRLAAEAATLDNLAGGRFDFGIGKGVRPGEFAKFGLAFDDALALQGFWYLSSLAAPPLPAEFSDARLKELTARVWGGRTYDEMDALGAMLIGSPEQVAAKVDGLEAIGVDTLLLVSSFGGLSHAQVCRSLELFARAVIHPRRSARTPVG